MKLLYLLLIFTITLYGTDTNKIDLHKKNLEKQIEKEKKYSQEQKFYMGSEYDLESFKVDEKSLQNIPEQPDYNEDFDMNNVYD